MMKDYEAEPTEDSVVSKINSGMLINLRLNELWKDAHRHSRQGQYAKWNDDLDRVWMELGGDEKEIDEKDEKYKDSTDGKYEKLIEGYAKSAKGENKKSGFNKSDKIDKVSLISQKKALMKRELFLRRLQNKQGKGTAYRNEDEDDF